MDYDVEHLKKVISERVQEENHTGNYKEEIWLSSSKTGNRKQNKRKQRTQTGK
jgi:hypothetical protein